MEAQATTSLTQEGVLKILSSREQLSEPTMRRVRVTGVTRYTDPNDGTTVYLTNYAAMTPDLVQKALEHLELGEFQQAGNTNLVSRQRLGIDFLPVKGQLVEIVVDWVPSRENPDVKKLRVVSVNPIAASESTKTDFAAMFAAKTAKAPEGKSLELTNGTK